MPAWEYGYILLQSGRRATVKVHAEGEGIGHTVFWPQRERPATSS